MKFPLGDVPANPSLEQLRKRAKEFRDGVRTGHAKFVDLARALHPRLADAPAAGWAAFSLADAQLVVARWYGFASWRRLREHLDIIARYSRSTQPPTGQDDDLVADFLRLACLTYRCGWGTDESGADDLRRHARARKLLAAHPELAAADIYTAAAVGDVAAARSLLRADASLAGAEGGPYGWPPLLYLTLSRVNSPGHSPVEVARLLLAHGADPNAGYLLDGEPPPVTALCGVFRSHRDPVNQPAHQHSLELARLLLEAGADPNDDRAVHATATFPPDDTSLALLVEHGLGRGSGGPWRARRLGGPSPVWHVQDQLRTAAELNLIDRARLLLPLCADLGIDVDAAPDGSHGDDHTPYDLAILNGNTEIADLLAGAGARTRPLEPHDELIAACLRADRPAVERLLAADPGLAARAVARRPDTGTLSSPLHHAALFNRPEAVRMLAAIGFPVNGSRESPLHIAALCGHLDMVKLLIELGADPTAEAIDPDTPGQFGPPNPTPLGWAKYTNQHAVIAYLTSTYPG
jgi:hypothetical protein